MSAKKMIDWYRIQLYLCPTIDGLARSKAQRWSQFCFAGTTSICEHTTYNGDCEEHTSQWAGQASQCGWLCNVSSCFIFCICIQCNLPHAMLWGISSLNKGIAMIAYSWRLECQILDHSIGNTSFVYSITVSWSCNSAQITQWAVRCGFCLSSAMQCLVLS